MDDFALLSALYQISRSTIVLSPSFLVSLLMSWVCHLIYGVCIAQCLLVVDSDQRLRGHLEFPTVSTTGLTFQRFSKLKINSNIQ